MTREMVTLGSFKESFKIYEIYLKKEDNWRTWYTNVNPIANIQAKTQYLLFYINIDIFKGDIKEYNF